MSDNSKLPKNICLECLTKLNQFNEFYTNSQENQVILQIIFGEKTEICSPSAIELKEAENAQVYIIEEIETENSALGDDHSLAIFEPIEDDSNSDTMEKKPPTPTPPEQKNIRKKRKFDRFDCYICDEQLPGNLNFLQHFGEFHPSDEIRYACFICPKYVKKYRSYTRHIESHSAKRFACDICDKIFSQKITLIQHLNCHSNIKSFKCEECGLNFKQNSSLFKHRKQKHSNESPTCTECRKTFVNSETLRQHMRSKHNVEKDICCLDCFKTFASRSALIYHQSSQHQKIKPSNTCQTCNKKFKTSVIKSRHMKKFHDA